MSTKKKPSRHARRCNPSARQAARPKVGANERHVDELILYSDNDSHMYKRKKDFLKNMVTKIRGGRFDASKAGKLWQYYTDEAAKRYSKEFGTGQIFTVADRKAAAEELAVREYRALMSGEYSNSPDLAVVKAPRARAKTGPKRSANPVKKKRPTRKYVVMTVPPRFEEVMFGSKTVTSKPMSKAAAERLAAKLNTPPRSQNPRKRVTKRARRYLPPETPWASTPSCLPHRNGYMSDPDAWVGVVLVKGEEDLQALDSDAGVIGYRVAPPRVTRSQNPRKRVTKRARRYLPPETETPCASTPSCLPLCLPAVGALPLTSRLLTSFR